MDTCSHCNRPVASTASYCPDCGKPRMLESLLAPREQPEWQLKLWNVVTILGVLLFLASSSVAFLREAKAVRVAREALASGRPAVERRAGEILEPFLAQHPRHEEGLYLAAVAGAKSGDLKQAASRRATLREVAPDRLEALDPELGQIIHDAVLASGCNANTLLGYYDDAGILGVRFRAGVLDELKPIVRRCLDQDQEQQAKWLLSGLRDRGTGAALVGEIYLEPLRQAVAAERYEEAERLVVRAGRFSDETGGTAQEILAEIREKVEVSQKTVEAACRAVSTAPGNRVGRYWCFPESAPPSIADVRDGWGRKLTYRALDLDQTIQCHQGFEVVSYGADGKRTAEPTGRPDTDLVCRFSRGRARWQPLPNELWR